jgi:hypothetical protein
VDTLSDGINLSIVLMADDDICGVSLSIRFTSNLVMLWNRTAPSSLPSSAVTPVVGSLPFSNTSLGVVEEGEQTHAVEKGVEKMKDVILAELPEDLRPQGWYYRVCSFIVTKY